MYNPLSRNALPPPPMMPLLAAVVGTLAVAMGDRANAGVANAAAAAAGIIIMCVADEVDAEAPLAPRDGSNTARYGCCCCCCCCIDR